MPRKPRGEASEAYLPFNTIFMLRTYDPPASPSKPILATAIHRTVCAHLIYNCFERVVVVDGYADRRNVDGRTLYQWKPRGFRGISSFQHHLHAAHIRPACFSFKTYSGVSTQHLDMKTDLTLCIVSPTPFLSTG
jgi:hypothetical protein